VSARVFAGCVLAALVLSPALARSSPTPVSSIPTLPKPTAPKGNTAVAGLKITTTEQKHGNWTTVAADTRHGYCVVTSSEMMYIGAETGGSRDKEDVDVYRLSDKDGTVSLEHSRVNVDFDSGAAKLVGRSSIELVEVARSSGVAAWAYRDGLDIVLVARNADTGGESPHLADSKDGPITPFINVQDCPWALARIDAKRAKQGVVAELGGQVAKTKSRFVVNASLSRVSRDPEPVLAVRVRVLESE
jgi:hypothetical protein